MAPSLRNQAALLDLPLEVLTAVCLQLDVRDLVRVAETCKRFSYGDDGPQTVGLPIKSPVIAFPRLELSAITRPAGCSES
jgi:hypothetical protein